MISGNKIRRFIQLIVYFLSVLRCRRELHLVGGRCLCTRNTVETLHRAYRVHGAVHTCASPRRIVMIIINCCRRNETSKSDLSSRVQSVPIFTIRRVLLCRWTRVPEYNTLYTAYRTDGTYAWPQFITCTIIINKCDPRYVRPSSPQHRLLHAVCACVCVYCHNRPGPARY